MVGNPSSDDATPRDYVWATAIKQLVENDAATANVVHERMDAAFEDENVPAIQTVRNVLRAMEAIGFVDEQSGLRSTTNVYTLSETAGEWVQR